jgi:hypothetical protein
VVDMGDDAEVADIGHIFTLKEPQVPGLAN